VTSVGLARLHREAGSSTSIALKTLGKAGSVVTKTLVRLQTYTRSLKNEEGATAVEYGLMVALIAAVIIAVVAALGGKLTSIFAVVGDGI
jgi:pilus assembly protein Flp/PilA